MTALLEYFDLMLQDTIRGEKPVEIKHVDLHLNFEKSRRGASSDTCDHKQCRHGQEVPGIFLKRFYHVRTAFTHGQVPGQVY